MYLFLMSTLLIQKMIGTLKNALISQKHVDTVDTKKKHVDL